MVRTFDVPEELFIDRLSQELKKDSKIEPPAWAPFVKTGSHAIRMPQNQDWWYVRCASLLRKLYVHGPVGLSDLKSAYGGRKKKKGYSKAHHRDAGGAVIRKALQQLESLGYIANAEGKGRALTPAGMKMLDNLARDIHKELIQILPGLKKYA